MGKNYQEKSLNSSSERTSLQNYRTVHRWNELPQETVNFLSSAVFMYRLDDHSRERWKDSRHRGGVQRRGPLKSLCNRTTHTTLCGHPLSDASQLYGAGSWSGFLTEATLWKCTLTGTGGLPWGGGPSPWRRHARVPASEGRQRQSSWVQAEEK